MFCKVLSLSSNKSDFLTYAAAKCTGNSLHVLLYTTIDIFLPKSTRIYVPKHPRPVSDPGPSLGLKQFFFVCIPTAKKRFSLEHIDVRLTTKPRPEIVLFIIAECSIECLNGTFCILLSCILYYFFCFCLKYFVIFIYEKCIQVRFTLV